MVFQCCAASYSGDKQKIILSAIAFSIKCSTRITISLRCNVKKTPGYVCKHCNWDKHAQPFGTVSLKYNSLAYCKEHNWYSTNVPSVYACKMFTFTHLIALVYINSIHDFFILL